MTERIKMDNKLHVYTGEGKGKTTAAMGLALRSLGHDNRVLVAQFMKNGISGELKALERFENAHILTAPPMKKFVFRMSESEKEEAKREQSEFAARLLSEITSFKPQLCVFDEVNVALKYGMLEEERAKQLILTALEFAEVACTGRDAPRWLTDMADYVSRIQAEKHPFTTEGLTARKGVEW